MAQDRTSVKCKSKRLIFNDRGDIQRSQPYSTRAKV
jgi:hypothetical protein